MADFIQFAIRHWMLSLAFVIVLAAIFFEEARGKKSTKTHLTPTDAVNLINHEHAVILDVRAETKFKEGHLVNAVNIPALSLTQQIIKQKNKSMDYD